ncbi:MAG: CBS domain-containing protein [Chloroflexi bacterium]|nr:MAG: CBS domain-containing protein [Chloroflexota bacterium]
MTLVRQILQKKGRQVYSTTPETSVSEALQLMAEKNIGALVVLDGDRLVGIISERDYARKVFLLNRTPADTPVKDIMTSPVYCIGPDFTLEQCMATMTDKRIRHLPVLENDKVIGVISIGDVVKAVISDKQFMIEQLENYIVSGGQ